LFRLGFLGEDMGTCSRGFWLDFIHLRDDRIGFSDYARVVCGEVPASWIVIRREMTRKTVNPGLILFY